MPGGGMPGSFPTMMPGFGAGGSGSTAAVGSGGGSGTGTGPAASLDGAAVPAGVSDGGFPWWLQNPAAAHASQLLHMQAYLQAMAMGRGGVVGGLPPASVSGGSAMSNSGMSGSDGGSSGAVDPSPIHLLAQAAATRKSTFADMQARFDDGVRMRDGDASAQVSKSARVAEAVATPSPQPLPSPNAASTQVPSHPSSVPAPLFPPSTVVRFTAPVAAFAGVAAAAGDGAVDIPEGLLTGPANPSPTSGWLHAPASAPMPAPASALPTAASYSLFESASDSGVSLETLSLGAAQRSATAGHFACMAVSPSK
jgi:hypothetical protein